MILLLDRIHCPYKLSSHQTLALLMGYQGLCGSYSCPYTFYFPEFFSSRILDHLSWWPWPSIQTPLFLPRGLPVAPPVLVSLDTYGHAALSAEALFFLSPWQPPVTLDGPQGAEFHDHPLVSESFGSILLYFIFSGMLFDIPLRLYEFLESLKHKLCIFYPL